MAKNLMHYTCCLIVLTSCVDQGYGRWKKKDRENLQHDIKILEKMTEKIEHEIELFYEDYSDENDNGNDIDQINKQYIVSRKIKPRNDVPNIREKIYNYNHVAHNNITNDIREVIAKAHETTKNISNDHVTFKNNVRVMSNETRASSTNWPKFEDILLAMGKRYDWKNDRWIKVKRKFKEYKKKVKEVDNSIHFHEKHKFSYKTIKLSRSKSRRNVVIAVSAVR